MNLAFTGSFAKDLRQIRDTSVLERLQETIHEIEAAASTQDLKNLKKLSAGSRHYRLRLGDYRLGLPLSSPTILRKGYPGQRPPKFATG